MVDELAARRCIIFLGSGASAGCLSSDGKSSPPTWKEFLEILRDQLSPSYDKSTIDDLIRKEKYLDKSKRIDNKKFKRSIKKVLKERKDESFSHEELAQIIINFKIIAALTQKFYSVYFELENALVVKLDLADVEYEVRGWKADFKNNIMEISDITGLKYLKQLKYLDISNNLIKNVKDLLNVEALSYLLISNNKIADIENLDYFEKMTNLVYLDISGNEFVAKIDKQIETLEVKLRKFYY